MITIDFLPILACPQCVYNRVQPVWLFFAVLRLAMILVIVKGSLDLVRTLGVFGIYEICYFYLWRLAIIGVYSDMDIIAEIGLLIFSSGLPMVLILMKISRAPYFRTNHTTQLTWRKALRIVPIMILLAISESQLVMYLDGAK